MKKKITVEVTEDQGVRARRRARRVVGTVKPRRVETPATKKPPKHKKQALEE